MVPQLRVLLVVVVIGCVLRGADASATSKANDLKAVYVQIVQEGQGEGKDCTAQVYNVAGGGHVWSWSDVVEFAGVTGGEHVSKLKKQAGGSYTEQAGEFVIQSQLRDFQNIEKTTKKTRCIAKKELVCVESNKCVKCKDSKTTSKLAKDNCESIEKIAKAGGGMKTPMMAVGTILVALLAFFCSQ